MKPIYKWLIAIALVTCALLVLCCGGLIWGGMKAFENAVYPKAPPMPAVVGPQMPALLGKLESAMAKNAPKTLAALGPGLSTGEIAALEKKYGVVLTPELRQLYLWRNGAVDKEQGASLVPYYEFLSLEETLAAHQEMAKIAGEMFITRYQKSWVCIVGSDEGGGYFYDPARSEAEGSFFAGARDDGVFMFFPSVRNFIAGVVECYETGAFVEGEEDEGLEEDSDKAEQVWKKYGEEVM